MSLPRDLTGVDLTPFGVIVEATKYASLSTSIQSTIWCRCTVGFMVCVSLGCACSLRITCSCSRATHGDYWMSAPYVAEVIDPCPASFAIYFQLGDADFNRIWRTAESIEE